MKYGSAMTVFFAACLVGSCIHPAGATTFTAAGIRMSKDVKTFRELKRQNVVTQSLDFSCGAAGLSTLLNFYLKDSVTEQEIIAQLLTMVSIEKVRERKGFSLLDLKTFAESRGYEVTGYQMDFEFLKNIGEPVLVPITFRQYSHFVVVRGVAGNRVFLADPAAGNLSMKADQFMRIWGNGIGLVIHHPQQAGIESYPLQIGEDDLVVADYKHLQSLMNRITVRTAVFPNEY